jgi:hypothetical protein
LAPENTSPCPSWRAEGCSSVECTSTSQSLHRMDTVINKQNEEEIVDANKERDILNLCNHGGKTATTVTNKIFFMQKSEKSDKTFSKVLECKIKNKLILDPLKINFIH